MIDELRASSARRFASPPAFLFPKPGPLIVPWFEFPSLDDRSKSLFILFYQFLYNSFTSEIKVSILKIQVII